MGLLGPVPTMDEPPAELDGGVPGGQPPLALAHVHACAHVRGMADALKRITVGVTPEQYAALREEATRRAEHSGGLADASAIIRELVARWMEEGKPKKARK
jgi:hypothetical protein